MLKLAWDNSKSCLFVRSLNKKVASQTHRMIGDISIATMTSLSVRWGAEQSEVKWFAQVM